MTFCFVQQIATIDASQGVENCRRFKGRGRRGKTYNHQKKEANVKNNSQPKSLSILYHTKTITTSGGGTTTYTNCKDSKPKISGQTWTRIGKLGCLIGSTTYRLRHTTRTLNGEICISRKKSSWVVSIMFFISPTSSIGGSIINHITNYKSKG